MVSYVRGPLYKSVKSIGGLNFPLFKTYLPDLILWGGAAGAGVAVFTEGVPLFKNTFYTKIPYFGSYWEYNPDPEDVPI
ncbi:ubiquinol-cytochrome c reductase core subunit 10 qcr10 [Scheffersomyces spartinae]|uniref:Ubiquinol-cytochrome c reductase core subunit 10 qcr10 n=1 Tax=Scheffersomyces spartinae TaxID=45513 RepID=A0A9P8AGX6_9ASCO|nr:ubiquinol-cytochrome c reductase core subunit 10 qcr10 [Scheffersomyces spartinae]KAG7192102.1 ubiquinol-cytochrome c reductase core subunit 10 qcr10 [Scheffersomyces spartinae]